MKSAMACASVCEARLILADGNWPVASGMFENRDG